jgi:hypothetical protein
MDGQMKKKRSGESKNINNFLAFSWLKYVGFSAFYPLPNLCFAAGNRKPVQNCHAARGRQKSTLISAFTA